MNRRSYTLPLTLAASFLLSLLYSPPWNVLINDMEVYRYIGMAISKGLLPYRDVFDHKPPLIYFLNYAGLLLHIGGWGIWMIDTALTLLATRLFFQLCKNYHLPLPWLLPILFNLMLRDHLISGGSNGTREFTAIFFLIFFCILMGKRRYRDLWLGVLSGLIFFMQQEQVLSLIPFLIYTISEKPAEKPGEKSGPSVWTRLSHMAAGFLIVSGPIIVYFAAHGALMAFWDAAFLFNFSWYTNESKSLVNHFSTIKQVLDSGNYEIPFMIAAIGGILALFFDHRKKGLILAALAALLLTMAPEMMGGRYNGHEEPINFYYYFVPVSTAVCILLFVITAFAKENFLSSLQRRLFYTILLCSSLLFTMVQHIAKLTPWDRTPIVASPEANYLRQHKPGDRQLYILLDNDFIYIYNELGIVSPTRWIYQHFWCWYPRWDPDKSILHSIGDDLLKNKTTYVIMDPKRMAWFNDPADGRWWLNFMNTYYEQVPLTGKQVSVLWKLKTAAP